MLEQPDKHKTWGIKSKQGHYRGTSLEHYRYYCGYFADTRAKRGSESMIFKHNYITSPSVTPLNAIVQVAKQLTDTLRCNTPPQLVESGIDQLRRLTSIFGDTAEAYEQQQKEDKETVEIIAHSLRVTKSTPPPSVEQKATNQAKNYAHDVPDLLVVTYDSDSDDEEDKEPARLFVPSKVVASEAQKGTPLPAWMPNYIT